MSKLKTKSTALILGVLVMSLIVGYVVFAWSEPVSSPPVCNTGDPGCDPPLNEGPAEQTKVGNLKFSKFLDREDDTYYVDPGSTGYSAIFQGGVGVGGVTSPAYELEVEGNAGADQLCLTGDTCITYWSDLPSGSGGADTDWFFLGGSAYMNSTDTILRIGIHMATSFPMYPLDINGHTRVMGNIYLGGGSPLYKVEGSADPTDSQDLVTLNYLEGYLNSSCERATATQNVLRNNGWTIWNVSCPVTGMIAVGGGVQPLTPSQLSSSTIFSSWPDANGRDWRCGAAYNGPQNDAQFACVARCCGQ